MGVDVGATEAKHTLESYLQLLRGNKPYFYLWLGEVVNNTGAWLNYVATLTTIERLAGQRGLLVSLVVILRLLPSLLLFPITGVVADSYSRELILLWSNLFAAVVVACFTLIQRSSQVWVLYVLLFLQCSASSFYDPARRALIPTIVTTRDLPLATTLDSYAWSLVGALGASLGGFAVSKLGASSCFLLNAVTYLLAACCAVKLKGMLASAGQGGGQEKAGEGMPLKEGTPNARDVEMAVRAPQATSPRTLALKATNPMEDHFVGSLGAALEAAGGRAEYNGVANDAGDETDGLIQARHGRATSTSGEEADSDRPKLPQSCWQATLEQCRGRWEDLKEGLAYISAPENRDAAVMCSIKASGAAVWGGADILQVRLSNLPSMHSLGDASTTLGLLFASVGLGCFVGPLVSNRLTPPRKHYLLRACAASFLSFLLGYLLMAVAPNIWLLLPATLVRSCGSSVVWISSTLLIQMRVPNELQGRAMALEMAAYVVLESVGAIFGGVAFDAFHLSERGVVLIMAGIAAAASVAWVAYAWSQWPKQAGGQEEEGREQEDEELLATELRR